MRDPWQGTYRIGSNQLQLLRRGIGDIDAASDVLRWHYGCRLAVDTVA